MRKLLPLAAAAALAALVLATGVTAATVTITITSSGFSPGTAGIHPGDSVTFVNHDTVDHQVNGGSAFTSPVLKPGDSWSTTFPNAGTFSYSDTKNTSFVGLVQVTVGPASVTLNAPGSRVVRYGQKVVLAGVLKPAAAGTEVNVSASTCGKSIAGAEAAATSTVNGGGAFRVHVLPGTRTSYTAIAGAAQSNPVTIRVMPAIRLHRQGVARWVVNVRAGQSLAGRHVTLQWWNGNRWRNILAPKLSYGGTAGTTTISATSFGAHFQPHRLVRVRMSSSQAGPCYAGAVSNIVRS